MLFTLKLFTSLIMSFSLPLYAQDSEYSSTAFGDSQFTANVRLPEGFNIELVGVYIASKDSFLCKKTLWSDGSFSRVPKHFDKTFTATTLGDLKHLAAPLVWDDKCISTLSSASIKVTHESHPVYFDFIDFTFVDDLARVPANQKLYVQSLINSEGKKYFIVTGNNKIYSYPGIPVSFELTTDSCETRLSKTRFFNLEIGFGGL